MRNCYSRGHCADRSPLLVGETLKFLLVLASVLRGALCNALRIVGSLSPLPPLPNVGSPWLVQAR